MKKVKKKMTPTERARAGGKATMKKYGSAHFAKLAKAKAEKMKKLKEKK